MMYEGNLSCELLLCVREALKLQCDIDETVKSFSDPQVALTDFNWNIDYKVIWLTIVIMNLRIMLSSPHLSRRSFGQQAFKCPTSTSGTTSSKVPENLF